MELFLYVVGGLACISLFILNGLMVRTVLPLRLLQGVQGRRWTAKELAIVVAPAALAAILGLLLLQAVFWTVLCGLSLAMFASAMTIWALGRRWPHFSFSRKIAWVFVLYLLMATAITVPSLVGTDIRWTHLRGVLALLVLVLFLAVVAGIALLGIGAAMVYFALASEIARSVFLSPPAAQGQPEPAETTTQPEPLPTRSDFDEPDSRSA